MGNIELRFLKETVQMRVKSGTGGIEVDGVAETTTSTSWVSVGIIKKGRIEILPEIKIKEKTKLREFLEFINKNKGFLIQIANLTSNFLKS